MPTGKVAKREEEVKPVEAEGRRCRRADMGGEVAWELEEKTRGVEVRYNRRS
jgi:hypothetical protein